MKRRDFTKLASITLCGLFIPEMSYAADNILGDWWGDLNIGPQTITLRLEILPDNKAILYSISQNNAEIPATKFSIVNTDVYAEFSSIGAKYTGSIKDGKIIGDFFQGTKFTLNFTREKKN